MALSWLQDIIKGKANQADHYFKIHVKVQKFQKCKKIQKNARKFQKRTFFLKKLFIQRRWYTNIMPSAKRRLNDKLFADWEGGEVDDDVGSGHLLMSSKSKKKKKRRKRHRLKWKRKKPKRKRTNTFQGIWCPLKPKKKKKGRKRHCLKWKRNQKERDKHLQGISMAECSVP